MGSNQKYSITFDIDWAPDFAIEHCLELLDKARISATFFATHETSLNAEIIKCGHTLGIHPNFLPLSSHGSDIHAVISKCLSFAPDAFCVRTHALVQSTPILCSIFSQFSQLKLDVSLFMHRSKFAHKCKWEHYGISFERLLYNWEDDAEFHSQRFASSEDLFFGDITVCNFHPLHVYLNSIDAKPYSAIKQGLGTMPLFELDEHVAREFINPGRGAAEHLKKIIASDAMPISLDAIR